MSESEPHVDACYILEIKSHMETYYYGTDSAPNTNSYFIFSPSPSHSSPTFFLPAAQTASREI